METSTLLQSIAGDVLQPGDEGYDIAAAAGRRTGSPALVIRPASAADVAEALRFATANGLEVAVKSGGHDSLGRSTNDGGLQIDLGSLAEVEVGPDRLVTVGGGARWGDVAAALAPHGLAISSGDTKSVGVGGLTLGGGVGWMVRAWGLAIDQLVSAEVVLANGDIVTAGPDGDADLFWAIRGGGGNFGVVTRFAFRAHELPDGIVSGTIKLEVGDDLEPTLRAWRDAMRAAPEELSATYIGMPAMGPGMAASSELAFVWAGGDLDAATAAIRPLLDAPGVVDHTIERMAYADVLEEGPPGGEGPPVELKFVDNNGFAADFDDDLVRELAAMRRELPDTVLMLRFLGGAYRRVPGDATAWGYRDTEAWIFSVAVLPEPMYDAVAPRVAELWSRLSPWLDGMYGNFSSLENAADGMYPPATLARLRELKRRYDPANVFHGNHNIAP